MVMQPGRRATEVDEGVLLDALVQTSYAVVDALTAVATRHELSLTLLRVGAILRDRTPTMSELATHLSLDRSTITGLVDRAVLRGLLRKVDDEQDRRSTRVTLTGAGRDLVEMCTIEVTHALAPLMTQLTPVQRRQLTRLLSALGVVG
jgi:DNA-binding MarR family transcriptional regulator